ncbi:CPBP family intramembrane metalloprotease [Virgibacillus profundi]|uniref:CPBP family intramembrane metalloprotease n=1 Tax=Virgibacillus profundi TaxID=2024555 RepID=A0A2A2I8G8_9BACI|nr:type II CAAX endopeptidase family protein [Virgibacillus profundi]PAV27678.1 CPBP family intramembrane metalloprotease [Virgibacillus profundi]PXY51833.1 CPBP family intramembrane metalloprotease [Virgibacillus profundi]
MTKRYWWVIITYIIMQFSGIVFAPLLYLLTPLGENDAVIYWSIFSFLLGLIIVLIIMKPDMKTPSHRNAASTGSIVLWSILGVFMAYFSQGIAALIEIELLGIEAGSENTQLIMNVTRATPLFMIIPMFIAPILEEIIFRKIIFGSFYKKMNFFFAALLSAVVFGIIHGEPQHILIYASMGFVFAFLYVKTKRIIVPIIVHMAMNSIVVLVQYNFTPEDIEKMQQQLQEMQMILIGG